MRKTLISVFVSMILIFATMVPTFGAVTSKTICLYKNQRWTVNNYDSRTGKYSTVKAQCVTVYPEEGDDNLKRIQVRVKNSWGAVISDVTVLKEGNSATTISLYEGYLDTTTVGFQFRTNKSLSENVYSVVSYDGR